METNQFDALARRLSHAGAGRRQLLRAIAGAVLGSALGAVAPRRDLAEEAAARPKRNRRARRDHDGALQAEGNRKKSRKKPKRRPPGKACGDGERDCIGQGVCVAAGECCPAERKCGNECYPKDRCCPGYMNCKGACVPQAPCCPGQKACDGSCIPEEDCCELEAPLNCSACEEPVCSGGDWICVSACEVVGTFCCDGACVSTSCPPGQRFDFAKCECVCTGGREKCADGTCCDGKCTEYTCCPADQDFCLGTCCIPGNRCVPNGRHGICCSPDRTHDCYIDGVFRGCYDPARCYCSEYFGVVCPR